MASNSQAWTPDKKAERILFETFWSAQGWKQQRSTPPEDFAYAKRAGYMFEPIRTSHKEQIKNLIRLRSKLDPRDVAKAFSDSITTGRLDLRSALGSYGAALRLPAHEFARREPGSSQCRICEFYDNGRPIDLNVLSFERFKWGGVRHYDPGYALFDLTRFEASARDHADSTHVPLLRILDAAASAPAGCTPSELVKRIAPIVPGSAAQRRHLIACLGYAGILQPAAQCGFFDDYPIDRPHPGGKNDWAYPVIWWRGRDGVNARALAFYFPDLKA